MNLLLMNPTLQRVFIEPWTEGLPGNAWILLMGFLVAGSCALVGSYLILRRMSLVGDAISHSVLPGLAVAFLITRELSPWVMVIGAGAAGILTTLLIEIIHSKSRVKVDAAIGITFTTLFAIGVILINLFAGRVHLDTECVLYGELSLIVMESPMRVGNWELPPQPILIMATVFASILVLITLFYKELLISSFDASLAKAMGLRPKLIHYALMAIVSVVVVCSFEAVGAVLVVAMLILPGATALILTDKLPRVHLLSLFHALLSTVLGFFLAQWLDVSVAAAMVVAGALLFVTAWFGSPKFGLISQWLSKNVKDQSESDIVV